MTEVTQPVIVISDTSLFELGVSVGMGAFWGAIIGAGAMFAVSLLVVGFYSRMDDLVRDARKRRGL